MASPIEPFMPYLNTFIFFAIYTTLYKNNPLYRIAQSLVVGIGAGYLIVAQIDAYNRGVVSQMFTAGNFNFNMLIPWVLGAGYLCIFVPQLINVYRAVSIITLTVGMGVVLSYFTALYLLARDPVLTPLQPILDVWFLALAGAIPTVGFRFLRDHMHLRDDNGATKTP